MSSSPPNMSCSSYLDCLWDGRQVAIQLLFWKPHPTKKILEASHHISLTHMTDFIIWSISLLVPEMWTQKEEPKIQEETVPRRTKKLRTWCPLFLLASSASKTQWNANKTAKRHCTRNRVVFGGFPLRPIDSITDTTIHCWLRYMVWFGLVLWYDTIVCTVWAFILGTVPNIAP